MDLHTAVFSHDLSEAPWPETTWERACELLDGSRFGGITDITPSGSVIGGKCYEVRWDVYMSAYGYSVKSVEDKFQLIKDLLRTEGLKV